MLADALVEWYGSGSRAGLDGYSTACLRRVWRAEHFSWWMTSMLHKAPGGDEFDEKLQLSQLRYVTTSTAAATSLAENYRGGGGETGGWGKRVGAWGAPCGENAGPRSPFNWGRRGRPLGLPGEA